MKEFNWEIKNSYDIIHSTQDLYIAHYTYED